MTHVPTFWKIPSSLNEYCCPDLSPLKDICIFNMQIRSQANKVAVCFRFSEFSLFLQANKQPNTNTASGFCVVLRGWKTL